MRTPPFLWLLHRHQQLRPPPGLNDGRSTGGPRVAKVAADTRRRIEDRVFEMSKPNVPASPPQPTTTEEAPCRVGSLVYISGEVNYALRAVSGDPAVLGWSTADFNQPVSQDMSLQTGPMASARVRIGPNAIQMSGDTLIDVL